MNKQIKPAAATALIVSTVAVILAVGLAVGYLFFWDAFDKESKPEHDLKVAEARVNAAPNDVDARIALGWAFVQVNKLDQAVEQYDNALKLDPNNEIAKYNLALVKIQRQDYNGARQDLEALQKENPRYLDVRATLGVLYNQIGQYKLAVPELEMVDAFDPGRVDVLYQLGIAYEKSGNEAKAKATFTKALQFNPNDQAVKKELAALN